MKTKESLALFLAWVFLSLPALTDLHAAVLVRSAGAATLVVNGVSVDAATKINEPLSAENVIQTADDGSALVEVEKGIFVEVRPNSQITLRGSADGAAADTDGNPIPLTTVLLSSGSVVVVGHENGLAAAMLQISSPRGAVSPVTAGGMLVSTTSSDPSEVTVRVVVSSGVGVITTPEGAPIPISSGLAIDLRPEGACFPVPAASLPDVQEDLKAIEATVSQVTSLGDVARTAKTRYSLWVVERSRTRT